MRNLKSLSTLVIAVLVFSAVPAFSSLKQVNVPEFTLTAGTEIIIPAGESRIVNDFGLDYEVAGFDGKEGLAVYMPADLPPTGDDAPLLMVVEGAALVKTRSESVMAQSVFQTGNAYAISAPRENTVYRILAAEDGSTEIAVLSGNVKYGFSGAKSEMLKGGKRVVIGPAGEKRFFDLSASDIQSFTKSPLQYSMPLDKGGTVVNPADEAATLENTVENIEAASNDEAVAEAPDAEPIQHLSRVSELVPEPVVATDEESAAEEPVAEEPEIALYSSPARANEVEMPPLTPIVIDESAGGSIGEGEGLFKADGDVELPIETRERSTIPISNLFREIPGATTLGVDGADESYGAQIDRTSRISTINVSLNRNRISVADTNKITVTATITDRNLRPAKGMNARFSAMPESVGVFSEEHVVTDENGVAKSEFTTNASLATINAVLKVECDGKEAAEKLEIVSTTTPLSYEISD